MSRRALVLCTGILATACFACAPPAAPPPPPVVPPPVTTASVTCPGGSPFISHVALIALTIPPYDPATFKKPPANTLGSLTMPEQMDLNAAFTAAPMRFQKALCKLDGIFIDPSASHSWGFRDRPSRSLRYIGLSQQSLWGSTGQSHAPIYSSSETSLIAQVLAQLLAPWPTPTTTIPNSPTFSMAINGNTSVDTSAMTVLAVLAHEYGHILWYDLVKDNSGDNYVPAEFCRSHPGVRRDGFFDNSWNSVSVPDVFLTFAKTSPDQHIQGNVQTAALTSAINSKQWNTVANDLNAYFTPASAANPNGVWPSVFGSVSPEEDFVEIFKIYIMTRPETNSGLPVTSMPLNLFVPGQPTLMPDIYQEITQGNPHERKRRMDCIDVKWAALVP